MAINTVQWAVFWLETAVLGTIAGALAIAALFGLLLALVIVRGGKRPGVVPSGKKPPTPIPKTQNPKPKTQTQTLEVTTRSRLKAAPNPHTLFHNPKPLSPNFKT